MSTIDHNPSAAPHAHMRVDAPLTPTGLATLMMRATDIAALSGLLHGAYRMGDAALIGTAEAAYAMRAAQMRLEATP